MLYFEILVLHFLFYFPKIRSSIEEIVVVFGGLISKPSVLSQLTPGINLFIIGSDVDSSLIIAQGGSIGFGGISLQVTPTIA